MLRQPPPAGAARRRRYYAPHLCCAFAAFFLLLLSLSVLHSRLSSSHSPLRTSTNYDPDTTSDLLDNDANNDAFDTAGDAGDDRIDALDTLDDALDEKNKIEIDDDGDDDDAESDGSDLSDDLPHYFWDHALGVKRQAFGNQHRPSIQWAPIDGSDADDHRSKIAFGSDDEPVDEEIRGKLDSIRVLEDALLLRVSGVSSSLRAGWAPWFEAKGRFLRQDRMFQSSLEPLDPRNHPLLQDPDISGSTGFTRGDRLMQKVLLKEMERSVFVVSKRVERKTLDFEKERKVEKVVKYADGRHWGYYPGLEEHSSFTEFMEKFLGRGGQCDVRVFMVWNSPPWAYGVRHQRGVESILHHHRDACVVVFSETMELDFFREFVKDGFKIAVAMPNLDELLMDTPDHIFASVWFEWRKTKHYPIHYSELIRLAALYKYGGIYIDSDVIVLKPLHSLRNVVGVEDQMAGNSSFSGAVMAFERHSPVILECLKEFHSTYDDTLLRWNGAELLTRVINRILGGGVEVHSPLDLRIEPVHAFFPITVRDIARYFAAPDDDAERARQDTLLKKIINESTTFHFWNGLTSALVPETGSLVEKLLNRHCLYCSDLL